MEVERSVGLVGHAAGEPTPNEVVELLKRSPADSSDDLVCLLLIEDHESDARLVREILKDVSSLRIELFHAGDLSSAGRWLESHRADVVLLDLELGETSGLRTLTRFQEHHAGVPVVLLTGHDDPELAKGAARVGAYDYIVKGELSASLMMRSLRYTLERRRIEVQLNRSQRLEAVGKLAGGVAHDFNNLLMVIQGYTSLLREEDSLSPSANEFLDTIFRATERAVDLTQQLLAFSRQQVLSRRAVDLNEVVREARLFLSRTIGEDVELKLDLDSSVGPVRADPAQLQQVVMNIAINARDAMPQGGRLTVETLALELETPSRRADVMQPAGTYTVLRISDNGMGMDTETLDHIFEPFYTTKGPEEGTGLGLSTVYGIIKQSGGFVWVHSELGKGASFEIHLPVADTPQEPGKEKARRKLRVASQRTVLLVEDEQNVRNLTRRMLEDGGYRVLEASSGALAIEIAKTHADEIDVLLTDVIMPHMSGALVADAVAEICTSVQTLFISGYTTKEVTRSGLLDPDTNYLQKPFVREELLDRLEELARLS